MFNYELCLNNIRDICREKEIDIKMFAILNPTTSLYKININEDILFPKILILGYKTQPETAIPYGIARFLDRVPKSVYQKTRIDIIPLVNPLNKLIEKKLIYRLLEYEKYNLILSVRETEGKFCIKASSGTQEICQRILDTAGDFYQTYSFIAEKIEVHSSGVKKNTIEHALTAKGIPSIEVYLPYFYEFSDRVVSTSQIIEDAIHESIYNFSKPSQFIRLPKQVK